MGLSPGMNCLQRELFGNTVFIAIKKNIKWRLSSWENFKFLVCKNRKYFKIFK